MRHRPFDSHAATSRYGDASGFYTGLTVRPSNAYAALPSVAQTTRTGKQRDR